MRQLVHTMFIVIIVHRFACGGMRWKENLVKHQKVSKYCENDCRLTWSIDYTNFIRPSKLDANDLPNILIAQMLNKPINIF